MATQWDHVRATFAERFEKAAKLMDAAKDEVLAFSAFPARPMAPAVEHDPLIRLNKELKRRCRVVGIFPTQATLIRLAGAVLLDTHAEWLAAERRYFSDSSMAMLYPERDDVDVATGELEGASAD